MTDRTQELLDALKDAQQGGLTIDLDDPNNLQNINNLIVFLEQADIPDEERDETIEWIRNHIGNLKSRRAIIRLIGFAVRGAATLIA